MVGLAGYSGIGAGRDGTSGGTTQVDLTVGTSVEGSTSFRIGSTFGQYLQQNDLGETFNWNAVVTPGATGGYQQMFAGEVDISGPSTYGLEASPDEGPFEEDPLENFDQVRQIRGFFSVQPFVVVRQDAGIESWADLEGKSISVGSAGAGTRVPSETIVDLAVGRDNVTIEYIGYSDQPSALRGGRIPAIFGYVNNARTDSPIAPGWMQEMDSTVDWTHLPFPDDVMQQFEEQLPYASTFTVDAGQFFNSYTDTLTAYNLTYSYVSFADLSPDVVYEITKLSYEEGEALLETDNAMGYFPNFDRGAGTMHPDVPVHQGAYDYYTEEGVWEDYDLTPPPDA